MEGYFITLIVIGEREMPEVEMMLPAFTEYIQKLYQETKSSMGQKWLMINVTDEAVLSDIMQLLAIRRNQKKKR
jgi:AraC family transcriptional regulator